MLKSELEIGSLSKATRRWCEILRWGVLAATLLLVIFFFNGGSDIILDEAWRKIPDPQRALISHSALKQAMLQGALMIGLASGLVIMACGFIVLSAFAAGETFSRRVVQGLWALGWALLANVLLHVLSTPVIALLLTYDNPPGDRILSVAFRSEDIVALVIGMVILTLSRIVRDAGVAIEENRDFV